MLLEWVLSPDSSVTADAQRRDAAVHKAYKVLSVCSAKVDGAVPVVWVVNGRGLCRPEWQRRGSEELDSLPKPPREAAIHRAPGTTVAVRAYAGCLAAGSTTRCDAGRFKLHPHVPGQTCVLQARSGGVRRSGGGGEPAAGQVQETWAEWWVGMPVDGRPVGTLECTLTGAGEGIETCDARQGATSR